MEGFYELQCGVQNYGWGKVGSSSLVAQLLPKGTIIHENTNYAELWMGDHQSNPSHVILGNGKTEELGIHISKNSASILGKEISERFNNNLPYLFKVLSINKALSVQAHPDASLASKLHLARPDLYKDPNHKPEVALAVSPMQALCEFRPIEEIVEHLVNVAPLRALIGPEISDTYISVVQDHKSTEESKKDALRTLFRTLLIADEKHVTTHLNLLIQEIQLKKDKSDLDHVVLRVHSEFPGDVGVFCLYLMNVVKLTPGQAIFLAPDEPHAYLQGDCIECMATSDNVVRAGLTPKYKDVPTLTNMLTYRNVKPHIYEGEVLRIGVVEIREYNPPVEEFKIKQITIPPSTTFTLSPSPGPSIFIVYTGQGELKTGGIPLIRGTVILVYATKEPIISSGQSELVLFLATSNVQSL